MVSEVELETLDLEWFALDAQGKVGRFTTGGRGLLPVSLMRMSTIDLDAISSIFAGLPDIGCALLCEGVGQKMQISGLSALNKYFNAMSAPARKGCWVFDSVAAEARPTPYTMIAMPETPLLGIDLPRPLQEVLETYRAPLSFSGAMSDDLKLPW